MMLGRRCLTSVVWLLVGLPALADEIGSPDSADPELIRLHLMDGSVIAGKLTITELELETKFGMLKVPITAIKSFTPGLASHPELSQRIESLIDQLGGPDYEGREKAQKTLISMGEPIRPELKKHLNDKDKERRERIRTILETLDEALDDGEFDNKPKWLVLQDAVETTEFTAMGRIVTPQFTVESKYGPLTVKLSDVRKGERAAAEEKTIEKSLSVDGSHLVQRGLKETGIRVERGDKIQISADGTIAMSPWGNNAFSTPDGGSNFGWLVQRQIPGGMLVATIGNNTQWIKVGSRATIRATKSGNLRLGVAMQNDYAKQEFPGAYQVKVVVDREPADR